MATRGVHFVIKTSKLCNLRCRYCYEMAELGMRQRIQQSQLRAMYQHIHDYYVAADAADGEQTEIVFCWHGGEPLLIEPEFYWQTLADQAEIFGDRLARSNRVQTNLTVLDDERLRLLRDGFDGVGVSVDLFGGLRVNMAGRDLQHTVLANLDTLRANGISFGCITVLHRGNIDKVERIWRFYERARIGFRVLPLYDSAAPQQNPLYAQSAGQISELSAEEINTALCQLADLWLTSDAPVPVIPLNQYLTSVVRHLDPDPDHKSYYDKRAWCGVLLVNTNGDCFTVGDPYGDPTWALGNIFTTPLGEIFGGEVFDRSAGETEKRIAANCLSCPYFGGCDGRRVGDERFAIYEYANDLAVCTMDKAVIGHLELRLREAGLIDADGRLKLDLPSPEPGLEYAG